MKDHERVVDAEEIPILFTADSKIRNSVVPQLFSMNYHRYPKLTCENRCCVTEISILV